jgi:hypothetical protein
MKGDWIRRKVLVAGEIYTNYSGTAVIIDSIDSGRVFYHSARKKYPSILPKTFKRRFPNKVDSEKYLAETITVERCDIHTDYYDEAQTSFRCPACGLSVDVDAFSSSDTKCSCGREWGIEMMAISKIDHDQKLTMI